MRGSGTPGNPYIIDDLFDLQNVNNNLLACYELGRDIDASPTVSWNGGMGFEPIGFANGGGGTITRRPISDEAITGTWTPTPGAPATLFDKVNEVVADDGTYIRVSVTGRATFNFDPIVIPTDAVHISVKIFIRRRRIAAGTNNVWYYHKIGGIYYGHESSTPGTTFANSSWSTSTNPATGLPWTPTDIMSLQAFGVGDSDGVPALDFSQVYLEITYSRAFQGVFDGKGHTISNLHINRFADPNYHYLGLFSEVFDTTIRNLSVLDASVLSSELAGGSGEAAILVAILNGVCVIENVIVSGIAQATNWYDAGGLVAVIDADANVRISNCYASGQVISAFEAGGLIGHIFSDTYETIIENCGCDVEVHGGASGNAGGFVGAAEWTKFYRCFSLGDVYGIAPADVGGFIGWGEGPVTFDQCYAIGKVEASLDFPNVGGFIGEAWEAILTNCYARGNAIALDDWGTIGGFVGVMDIDTEIHNCYSTGKVVSGGPNGTPGGFCGADIGPGIATHCFWDTENSGILVSAWGTGLVTALMKIRSTFETAGWNFTLIWYIATRYNNGYPCFLHVPTYPYTSTTGGGTVRAPSPATGPTGGGPGGGSGGAPVVTRGSVQTGAATDISENHATINGFLLDDGGSACSVYFEYGVTSSYGNRTSPQAGFYTGDSFSAIITGIAEGVAYHYRAVGVNRGGTFYGADATFSTPSALGPVTYIEDKEAVKALGV